MKRGGENDREREGEFDDVWKRVTRHNFTSPSAIMRKKAIIVGWSIIIMQALGQKITKLSVWLERAFFFLIFLLNYHERVS